MNKQFKELNLSLPEIVAELIAGKVLYVLASAQHNTYRIVRYHPDSGEFQWSNGVFVSTDTMNVLSNQVVWLSYTIKNSKFYELVESHWYDDIPENGVLCVVEDDLLRLENSFNRGHYSLKTVTEYCPEISHPFRAGVLWKYAYPVDVTIPLQESLHLIQAQVKDDFTKGTPL